MSISNLFTRILSLLSIGLVASAILCQAQITTTKFQLQGKVVDQHQSPITGAKITVMTKGYTTETIVITDQTGKFLLPIESGEYTLKVSAKGFSESSQTIKIKQDNAELPNIILQIAGTNAVVMVGDTESYKAETTRSATKTSTPLRDIPQSITVITNEQIKDQMMQSIGDIVRYTPGLSVHQGENNRDQVIIRGQNTSADFFLNGVRDDVQYYRDLYNLERLETLKGPNAMIFGRGGGGGVINRVTKEAQSFPLREISIEGGSFYNRRISADFNQPFNDKIAFRLNSVYENSDSFRKYVSLKRFAINPTLTFNLNKNTKATIGYEFARDRRIADRGITSFQGRPVNIPINTYFGNPNDSRVRSNVNILTGSIDHQFGKLNIHNRTTYGNYDRFYQNYVPGAVNTTKTLVALTAYNNATKRKNLFSQTDLTYTIFTGQIKHTILGGIELGRQLTDNFRKTGYFNNLSTRIRR